MEQLLLSWEAIDDLVDQVALQVRESGFKPDLLVGIAVGGLIPLTLISKKLGVRDTATISASAYDAGLQRELRVSNIPARDMREHSVLVVDEITDTGTTLQEILHVLKELCGAREVKSATLVVRADKCKVRPDFSALDVEQWVRFPWETSEEAPVHTED